MLYRLRASDNPSFFSFVNLCLVHVSSASEKAVAVVVATRHYPSNVPLVNSGTWQTPSAADAFGSRDLRLPGQRALSSYPEKFITTLSQTSPIKAESAPTHYPSANLPTTPIIPARTIYRRTHTHREDDVPHRPPDRQGRRPSRRAPRQEIRELRRDEAGRLAGRSRAGRRRCQVVLCWWGAAEGGG